MKVIKLTPQGYCFGVVRAINIVKETAQNEPKPIYILGDIVHNELISKSLQDIDIITVEAHDKKRLELLEQIDKGTVIFTAHGISPLVKARAIEKNLNIIDATCPEVTKTQDQIIKHLNMGYDIVFVGKKNHPEAEACIDIDSSRTIFISKQEDIEKEQYNANKYYIAYQSTLNTDDTKKISKELEKKLNDKIFINQRRVCDATFARQQAVKELTDAEFLIVVGDKNSNNSNKLVEISPVKAQRILSVNELDLEILKDVNTIAITSGASTPTQLTKHIIKFFEQFEYNDKSTWSYSEFNESVI